MRTLVPVALAAALFLPATARAQDSASARGVSLTLEEAIALAQRNNPVFLSQANDRSAADAAVRSARGAFLPSADASFAARYQQGGQQVFNGLSFSNSSATRQSSYDLSLNYRINSATFVNPRAAVANRNAVEADITGAAEQLRAAVTQQYLTVLQAQARAALQDTLVNTAQVQLDLAKAKVAVGSGTILDVRSAEVALGRAQVAQLTEQNNVEVEKLRLYQQMGVPQPTGVVLTTEFRLDTPMFSLDSLLELARRANPAIVALRSRERAADLNTKVAKAAYTPTLSLSTGWGGNSYEYADPNFLVNQARNGALSSFASCMTTDSIRTGAGMQPFGCSGPKYNFTDAQAQAIRDANNQFPFRFNRAPMSFSAVLSIPVFDNFNREQRVEQAQIDRDNARLNVRARELQMTADVTQAYLNLVAAQRTVELQEVNAQRAREELAYATERYRVGAATFLDVTTSNGTFVQAQVDRINSIYDYHRSFAALEAAIGRPLR